MGAPLRDSEYIPANTETTSKFINLGLENLSLDIKLFKPYSPISYRLYVVYVNLVLF